MPLIHNVCLVYMYMYHDLWLTNYTSDTQQRDLNHCRDIFCAGRVVDEDLRRTMKACGGAIQTSVNGLTDSVLGTCKAFQEEQIGGDR